MFDNMVKMILKFISENKSEEVIYINTDGVVFSKPQNKIENYFRIKDVPKEAFKISPVREP